MNLGIKNLMKHIPAIVGAMDSEITMYLEHSEVVKENVWGEFIFYEVPISYRGRSYEAGKKITLKDAFIAFYCIFKYRFFD